MKPWHYAVIFAALFLLAAALWQQEGQLKKPGYKVMCPAKM